MPVTVLTSSISEYDIRKTYDLRANCYIAKPVEFVNYQEVLKPLRTHWFDTVALPSEPN